jgi:hypothetical protein
MFHDTAGIWAVPLPTKGQRHRLEIHHRFGGLTKHGQTKISHVEGSFADRVTHVPGAPKQRKLSEKAGAMT